MMGSRHQAVIIALWILGWTTPQKQIFLLFHDIISPAELVLWPLLICILDVLGTVTYIK